MATLDDLLKMDGVAAACEFTADGKPLKFKANMEMAAEMGAMMAQFCGTVTMLFNTLAGSFTKQSGQNWVPQQGWMYAGGDWTVCIGGGGYRGVFVQTAKADFNKLFQALVGPR